MAQDEKAVQLRIWAKPQQPANAVDEAVKHLKKDRAISLQQRRQGGKDGRFD
jgi:hypothetical protein